MKAKKILLNFPNCFLKRKNYLQPNKSLSIETMDEEPGGSNEEEKPTTSEVEIELDTEAEWLTSNNVDADLKLEPPDLPQFVDTLKICEISPEIEKRLAMMLDLPAVGDSLRNWEWLAFALGMSWEEIKYLRIRAQHPSSPTSELLWRYRGENFGRLLKLIRDELRRFDVIVDLLPALLALEETLKLDRKRVDKTKEKCEQQDSGVLVSGNASDTQPSTSTFHRHANVEAVFNLKFSSSSIDPTIQNRKNVALESEIGRISSKSRYILVTYYADSDLHLKTVNWLCKNLKENGADVVRTEQLLRDVSDDLSTGFTSAFNKATFIVVVCSAGYRRCVETNDTAVVADVHSQYTLFLFKLMFAEYKELNCKNRRFRPILFNGSSDVDVPSFLKNTLVHRWPDQNESFMDFLFGDDQAKA